MSGLGSCLIVPISCSLRLPPSFLMLLPPSPHICIIFVLVLFTQHRVTERFLRFLTCSTSGLCVFKSHIVTQNSGKQNSRQTTRQRVGYFATSAEFRYGCCCYFLTLGIQPRLSHDLILWAGREQGASPSQTFSFPLVITPLNSFCLNRA